MPDDNFIIKLWVRRHNTPLNYTRDKHYRKIGEFLKKPELN